MTSRWSCVLFLSLLSGCQSTYTLPAAVPTAVAVEPPEDPRQTTATPAVTQPSSCEPAWLQVGAVKMQIIPQFRIMLAQPGGEVALMVRMALDETMTREEARPPLDLALVIDRSGSMSGDKIRSVKEASLGLLRMLTPKDRLSLLSYSDDVQIHLNRKPVSSPVQADARSALLQLQPAGSTALGPALLKSLEMLQSTQREQSEVAHVLLLSDGIANQGESSPSVLGERAARGFGAGVSVSTLGVGLDYNEDLMTHLADQGGGRYHFIKQDQDISRVLTDEMASLNGTVARSMTFQYKSRQGMLVKRVYGYTTATEAEGTFARIGSLRRGQRREVVVKITGPSSGEERAPLGQLSLRFLDERGQAHEVSAEVELPTTTDPSTSEQSECAMVSVRVAEVEAAEQMVSAAKAVEEGRVEEAKTILKETAQKIEKEAAKKPGVNFKEQKDKVNEALRGIDESKKSESARKDFVKSTKKGSYDFGKK